MSLECLYCDCFAEFGCDEVIVQILRGVVMVELCNPESARVAEKVRAVAVNSYEARADCDHKQFMCATMDQG